MSCIQIILVLSDYFSHSGGPLKTINVFRRNLFSNIFHSHYQIRTNPNEFYVVTSVLEMMKFLFVLLAVLQFCAGESSDLSLNTGFKIPLIGCKLENNDNFTLIFQQI